MSTPDDLIKQIPNDDLRKLIDSEFKKLRATKKFGLVFDSQAPEVTPLFDVPIKKILSSPNLTCRTEFLKIMNIFFVMQMKNLSPA